MPAPSLRFLRDTIGLALLMVALSSVRSRGAEAPATPASPEYAAWAELKEGAWVRVRVLSNTRNVERTTKLVKVTPTEVRLEETEAGPGEAPGKPHERVVHAKPAKPAKPAAPKSKPQEEGDEKVPVATVELKCHWETRGKSKPGEKPTAGDTTWTCPGVPGFVKKVSWLPADPDLGLPEVRATELLVAFALPAQEQRERQEPGDAGGQKTADAGQGAGQADKPHGPHGLPVHAEPPPKFSWTYRFDPPGWRHWSRVDDSTWEEKWQTGESTHSKIVGWIAEGEMLGTLVHRDDNSVETVIPDAGKGAVIWFRNLPNGKWSQLGTVEESE